MPVVITYTGATPTVDADEDVWGDELNNDALAPIKADLDALASQGNASEPLAAGALQKSGGTMTGDIVLSGGAATAATSVGFRGLPIRTVTASGNLQASDSGGMVRVTGAVAITITVPAGIIQTNNFVTFRNVSSQPLTIARGGGVQLRYAGSATDKNITIAPQGVFSMQQEDLNVWYGMGVGSA